MSKVEIEFQEDNRYIELAKQCIGLDRNKPYTRHGKRFYKPAQNQFHSSATNEIGGFWSLRGTRSTGWLEGTDLRIFS